MCKQEKLVIFAEFGACTLEMIEGSGLLVAFINRAIWSQRLSCVPYEGIIF